MQRVRELSELGEGEREGATTAQWSLDPLISPGLEREVLRSVQKLQTFSEKPSSSDAVEGGTEGDGWLDLLYCEEFGVTA